MTTSSALQPRTQASPSPISWPPSEYWDGDDGRWSSFALRVGNPEQSVRVLISTADYNTKVVSPGGCPPGYPGITPSLTCPQSRGELFNASLSSTWSSRGNYSLGLESNLGYSGTATYGFDTVALGFSNDTGGPSLPGQVVASLETNLFYTGLFGLNHQPTNFTASQDTYNLTDTVPYPSFLTTLKNQSLIPSLSWAYTAGAAYRLKGVFGSLTLGGYDSSRLVPNNVTFDLAPDISRDLVVGLQSITSTAANGSQHSLLPNPILTFIDSTLPLIYLPLESCQAFENAFGLTYDNETRLYTVDDSLHQSLTTSNPNITFELGNSETGGPTVEIVLPYASFDLLASPQRVVTPQGVLGNATRYFPLKRAANETQYTLGRTFLQEAYLITNYEHNNFSVSQARFEDGLAQNIVAIPAAAPSTTPISHDPISRKAVIGLTIGPLIAFLGFVAFLIYFRRKRLREDNSKKDESKRSESPGISQDLKAVHISGLHEADNDCLEFTTELADNGKVELLDDSLSSRKELPDSGKVELLDGNSPSGSGHQMAEMAQSPSPTPLCELETGHTFLATSSPRRQSDMNRKAIYVRTGISRRESSDSSGALKETPCVETRIFSTPQLTPEYLNRALPSTPTSDSTELSLAKSNSFSPTSTASSVTSAHSGTPPPDTAIDVSWKEYDMSWEATPPRRREPSLFDIRIMMPATAAVGRQMIRKYASLSSMSPGMEQVVAPGTPESQIPRAARSRVDERRTNDNFI